MHSDPGQDCAMTGGLKVVGLTGGSLHGSTILPTMMHNEVHWVLVKILLVAFSILISLQCNVFPLTCPSTLLDSFAYIRDGLR